MVGAPAAADAVRRARELPGLRVGLHLVLADGSRCCRQRAFRAAGRAQGRFGDAMVRDGARYLPVCRAHGGSSRPRSARSSRRSPPPGLALDHVNAHKHFHLHPTVLALMLRIGRDYGLQSGALSA